MNRDEFSRFVEATLDRTIQFAEQIVGRTLPRNIAFMWMGRRMEPIRHGVVEEITSKVFVAWTGTDGPFIYIVDKKTLGRETQSNTAP